MKVCLQRDTERQDASDARYSQARSYGRRTKYSLAFCPISNTRIAC